MSDRASITAAALAVLRPLVGGRVHARSFPQPSGLAGPMWPAIRYTVIDLSPTPDLCGGGDEDAADIRVQFDVVSDKALGEPAHNALVRQVRQALSALGRDWVWDAERDLPDDLDKKTSGTSIDFVVYLSSEDVAAP